MAHPNSPNDDTDGGKARDYIDPNTAFVWPSDWPSDSDGATNVNTPKPIGEGNADGPSTSSCSSEESETSKGKFDGSIQSWVRHGADNDGVTTESRFYQQTDSKDRVRWGCFPATYANGHNKKVPLGLEPTYQHLTVECRAMSGRNTPCDGKRPSKRQRTEKVSTPKLDVECTDPTEEVSHDALLKRRRETQDDSLNWSNGAAHLGSPYPTADTPPHENAEYRLSKNKRSIL